MKKLSVEKSEEIREDFTSEIKHAKKECASGSEYLAKYGLISFTGAKLESNLEAENRIQLYEKILAECFDEEGLADIDSIEKTAKYLTRRLLSIEPRHSDLGSELKEMALRKARAEVVYTLNTWVIEPYYRENK